MIDRRRADLERHLDDLRKIDGWQPFQHFVLGLLHHEGYTDVRYSAPRSDFGRDAVAITPDGKRCVVAVSFECTKAKVLSDAKRFTEDPDREKADVLLFITSEARAETTWSKWKKDVAKLGLELRMFGPPTILQVATRDRVWRETAARLGLSADRPGFRVVMPYDGEQIRGALQARPAEWLSKQIELREWKQLEGELRNRLILGKPGAGKTTTLFKHLEETRPDRVLVVEPDLRDDKVEGLLDSASGGAVIVFDDAHEKPSELRALMSGLRARLRDVQE
ncbi:MAG TPA: restriction endonuclease, partial [Longimicrobium sp.]